MGHGCFCYVELSTRSLAVSRTFYQEIFGWKVEGGPGMERYALLATPDGVGGGLNAAPSAEAPSAHGPILHSEMDDIEKASAQINYCRGQRPLAKTKISDDFGFFALFLASAGNWMGL